MTLTPGVTMNPLDWIYLSEGAAHVVFAYHPHAILDDANDYHDENYGSERSKSQYVGKVLRIRKEDINIQPSTVRTASTKLALQSSNGSTISYDHEPRTIRQKLIHRGLCPYVDAPVSIRIHSSFAAALRDQTLQNGLVPSSRMCDWCPAIVSPVTNPTYNTCSSSMNNNIPIDHDNDIIDATLHPNYFQMPILDMHGVPLAEIPNVSQQILSLEIKPKAGYLPKSPLIHPSNRNIKMKHTYFEILQYLHHDNIIKKGWTSLPPDKISHYNPIHLFSNQRELIQNALRELFICPQNNLVVTYDNHDLFSHDITTLQNKFLQENNYIYDEVLNELFLINNDENDNKLNQEISFSSSEKVSTILQEITTEILYHESFLTKLLRFQTMLDILDADGAILVYEHLVRLCNGSFDEAERCIDVEDHYLIGKDVDLALQCDHFQHYFGTESLESHALIDLCNAFQKISFDQNCMIGNKLVSSSLVVEDYYQQGIACICNLSKDDCIYLLQNWLLGQCMNDLSFFITLRPTVSKYSNTTKSTTIDDLNIHGGECSVHEDLKESKNCLDSNHSSSSINDDKCWTILKTQDECIKNENKHNQNKYGTIVNKRNGLSFQYSIKVVDIDGKPAKKLRNRKEREMLIKLCKSI
jgi:hypothetical protein